VFDYSAVTGYDGFVYQEAHKGRYTAVVSKGSGVPDAPVDGWLWSVSALGHMFAYGEAKDEAAAKLAAESAVSGNG
jgi:hypothetical protein